MNSATNVQPDAGQGKGSVRTQNHPAWSPSSSCHNSSSTAAPVSTTICPCSIGAQGSALCLRYRKAGRARAGRRAPAGLALGSPGRAELSSRARALPEPHRDRSLLAVVPERDRELVARRLLLHRVEQLLLRRDALAVQADDDVAADAVALAADDDRRRPRSDVRLVGCAARRHLLD